MYSYKAIKEKYFIIGIIVSIIPCISFVFFQKNVFFLGIFYNITSPLFGKWINVAVVGYLLVIGFIFSEILFLIIYFCIIIIIKKNTIKKNERKSS